MEVLQRLPEAQTPAVRSAPSLRSPPDKLRRPIFNRIVYGLLVAVIAPTFIWMGGIPKMVLRHGLLAQVALIEFYWTRPGQRSGA